MLDALHRFSSSSRLLTLRDLAPYIGFTVMVILIVVIAIVIVKYYQYTVKKGFEEYEREHGVKHDLNKQLSTLG